VRIVEGRKVKRGKSGTKPGTSLRASKKVADVATKGLPLCIMVISYLESFLFNIDGRLEEQGR
jgi:hypothetical protein